MKNLLYRLKYNYGRHFKLNIPVDISLELSSFCNLKCPYCYHADFGKIDPELEPFKRGYMEKEIAEKIIYQGATLGVNSIKINWKGESTLHPDYPYLLHLIKSLADGSTYMDRLTNSNFAFKKNRDEIIRALTCQTKVKVSFDSFRKDVFEKQRVGANHELVLKNIDDFYNHPKRKDTQLIIQAVRTDLNKNEDIESEAKRWWPDAEVSIRDMVEGRTENNIDELVNKERDFSERQPCKQAFVRLIFDHEGNASPCCPDITGRLHFGNIKDRSIYQLFNSPQARQLRKNLINGKAFDLMPCKTCSSFESFKNYKANWQS